MKMQQILFRYGNRNDLQTRSKYLLFGMEKRKQVQGYGMGVY